MDFLVPRFIILYNVYHIIDLVSTIRLILSREFSIEELEPEEPRGREDAKDVVWEGLM